MAHTVEIKEIINGVQITETIDADIVVKLISYQSKPFLRTTNESAEETYQVLDIVGEIYNTPALATDFRIIDANDNVFIPANGVELIEYSLKIRAFRPDADVNEVLAVGPITTTSNSVTLGLHPSGTNAVRIDGLTYEKYYPDLFNFTPVTTGEKILIIHALPDAQVFHLVQGAESTEAVEPAYTGLFVARILVNSTGQVVEEEETDYKLYADDAWRNFSINEAGVYTINMANSLASSFSIDVAAGVATPTIGLIKQKSGKSFRDGAEFWIHNISNKDIILDPTAFTDFDVWKHITFAETTIVKAESWAKLKIKYGELVVIEMGGGASVASEVENDSTVTGASVKDALETINARTSSVVDKMLHYWDATAGKWLSSGAEFISNGIIKVKSIILTTNTGTALPDELGFDGTNVFFGNTKRKLRYNDSTVFTYTPTGNFTLSTVKTAMETAGYIFNDSHIIIVLGTNNYTCSIDIGAANPSNLFTITRTGTGSLSFSSTRTLNAGVDSITIMNGNESSMALIQLRATTDFLTIRNK